MAANKKLTATPAFTRINGQGWHTLVAPVAPREAIELPADSPFIRILDTDEGAAWFVEPSSYTQYVIWRVHDLDGSIAYYVGIRYDEPTQAKLDAFKAWVLAAHAQPTPAANGGHDGAVTVDDVQAVIDTVDWLGDGEPLTAKVEQLSDGVGVEYTRANGELFSYATLGATLEEAMAKAQIMTADTPEEAMQAELTRLRERAAAAEAERDALRRAAILMSNALDGSQLPEHIVLDRIETRYGGDVLGAFMALRAAIEGDYRNGL